LVGILSELGLYTKKWARLGVISGAPVLAREMPGWLRGTANRPHAMKATDARLEN